jgi:hypothetical protein
MEKPPETNDLDNLLRKYLRVWIWSIIFTVDATLAFILSTQAFVGKYTPNNALILITPTIGAAISLIASFYCLLLFLNQGLIPILRVAEPESSGLRYLTLAMQFSIFAVMMRSIGFVFEAVFGSLGRF